MTNAIVSKEVRIEIIGVNPYVFISKTEAELIKKNWRKPIPVLVQVNGKPDKPWNINMVPKGNGDYYLYLHNEVRKAAKVGVGDTINIAVWFDENYVNGPQHPVPDWFSGALLANNAALSAWGALSPSRQKDVIRYFHNLKSDEAKKRNLALAINALSGKPTHFLGRNWVDGK